MYQGWVKLHRILLDDPIWKCTTPIHKAVFITLLLDVNYSENEWEWQGKPFKCKAGQLITSLDSLASKCGKKITPANVRSALDKFVKYGFITNESTKTGRLITIVNWEKYQINDAELYKGKDKELANTGQTKHKVSSPIKEGKNYKNKKKGISPSNLKVISNKERVGGLHKL
jgi:DNA replication protein DnaD